MRLLSINCVAVSLATFFIAATAGIVLGVTTAFTDTAADDFGTRLTAAIANGGRSKVADYLRRAYDLEQATRWGYESGSYPYLLYNNSRELLEGFMRTHASHLVSGGYDLSQVGAGFEDGMWFYGAVVNPARKIVIADVLDPHISNPSDNSTFRRVTFTYSDKTLISRSQSFIYFDPRVRDWYMAVKAAGVTAAPRFSRPFMHFLYDYYITSLTGPIVNSSNPSQFIGSTFVGLDLSIISNFLRQLPATAGSVTALVDREGLLLGVSDGSNLTQIYPVGGPAAPIALYLTGACANGTTTGNTVCRFAPTQSHNALLADAAAHAPDVFRPQDPRPIDAVVTNTKIKGKPHFVAVAGIKLAGTVDMAWKLITIVPAADITGEIVRGRNIAIGVGAAAAVFAAIVCVVALYVLLRPLREIAQRMLAASTLRSSNEQQDKNGGGATSAVKSSMREIITIEAAFETLYAQLMRARAFLPTSLLAQLDADSDDEDGGDEDDATAGGASGTDQNMMMSSTGRHSHVSAASDAKSHVTATAAGNLQQSARRHSLNSSLEHSANVMAASPLTATAAAAGAAGPRKKIISVLALNLRHFHAQVATAPCPALGEAYAALVDAVTDGARLSRGVLDSFHGDRFLITFNAAIGCASHPSAAVTVAARLREWLEGPITIGLATGPAHVGNMGSERTRRLNNVGPVVPQALLLERLAKYVPGASVLLTRAIADDTQHVAQHLLVECLPLPGLGAAPVPVAALRDLHRREGATDEWMYELQAAADAQSSVVQRLNALFIDAITSTPTGPQIGLMENAQSAASLLTALDELAATIPATNEAAHHAARTIRRLLSLGKTPPFNTNSANSTPTATAGMAPPSSDAAHHWGLFFAACLQDDNGHHSHSHQQHRHSHHFVSPKYFAASAAAKMTTKQQSHQRNSKVIAETDARPSIMMIG